MVKLAKPSSKGNNQAHTLSPKLRDRTALRRLHDNQRAYERVLADKVRKGASDTERALRAMRAAQRSLEDLDRARRLSPIRLWQSQFSEVGDSENERQGAAQVLEVVAARLESTTVARLRREERALRRTGRPPKLARLALIDALRDKTEDQIADALVARRLDTGPAKKIRERVRVELNRFSDQKYATEKRAKVRAADVEMNGHLDNAAAADLLKNAAGFMSDGNVPAVIQQLNELLTGLPAIDPQLRASVKRLRSDLSDREQLEREEPLAWSLAAFLLAPRSL